MAYTALVSGVGFGTSFLGSSGVSFGGHGVDRGLSGKPTFWERPFKACLLSELKSSYPVFASPTLNIKVYDLN